MTTDTKTLRLRLVPFFPFALLIALTAIATGCSNNDSTSPAQTQVAMLEASSAKIRYRFNDAPIPPPGHRSYTLLIDPDNSVLSFDAYGEDLGEQVQATNIDRVDEVLNRLSLSDLPEVTDNDCVSGPAYSLKVTNASDIELRSISVIPCDSDDDEIAEIENIIEPVLELFDLN